MSINDDILDQYFHINNKIEKFSLIFFLISFFGGETMVHVCLFVVVFVAMNVNTTNMQAYILNVIPHKCFYKF
jgi:ABC-type lipoprotein release transport system permease subunit